MGEEIQGIPLGVKRVPADQAIPAVQEGIYPKVEELIVRASVKSNAQAMDLLLCIQAVVNELGADTIIALVRKLEKDPSIITKAQKYLPYLNLL